MVNHELSALCTNMLEHTKQHRGDDTYERDGEQASFTLIDWKLRNHMCILLNACGPLNY